MAWVTPPTWATTSSISINSLNNYLTDNLLSLRNNWGMMTKCRMAANQSIGATVYTPTTYLVHDFVANSTALHTTASGSKFMAPVAGYWRLMGTHAYASASGWAGVAYRLNTTTPNYDMSAVMSEVADPRQLFYVEDMAMTTADTLQVMSYIERNTSGTLLSGASATRVTWQLLGAAS